MVVADAQGRCRRFAVASAGLGLAWITTPSDRPAWAGGALLVGALLATGLLRSHSFVVATWAAGICLAVALRTSVWRRLLVATVLVSLVPIPLGLGPAALPFVKSSAGTVDSRRAANAEGAATAFAPDSQAEEPDRSGEPGSGRRVEPDPGAVAPGPRVGSDGGALPGLRGLEAVLVGPVPWRSVENPRVALARVDLVLWYPLLAGAVLGLTCLWRRRLLTFPFLYVAGMTLVYSLAEGNFGTAFRHRGELVWGTALLAAFGLGVVRASIAPARSSAGTAAPVER